jgi:hypothetical protein
MLMIFVLVLTNQMACPVLAFADDSTPSEASFITRAVFADGRLWVLSEDGRLSSIAETEKTWTHNIPGRVIDLCVQQGDVVVIADTGNKKTWMLRRFDRDRWSDVAAVQSEGEKVLALACDANELLILTKGRLISIDNGKMESVMLSGDLSFGWYSVYATADQVLVGINAGEWGGGLRRIDRRTGAISDIQRVTAGELCGGPLNSSCDPVNGIAALPWKPDCVMVAVGLVHLFPHGRLDEVCGDAVERVFFKPYASQPSNQMPGAEPGHTVAFFGLVRQGDILWAVGTDGVYKIDSDGVAQLTSLPHFAEIDGVWVSFDIPNLVLVQTSVYGERSLSGSVPLLVAR